MTELRPNSGHTKPVYLFPELLYVCKIAALGFREIG
jgi:hypothetical protein